MHVMRELRDEKLDFWIKNSLNVLMIGHYGAGKTTRIIEAFKRNNLKYKYFSAATMDPWCDFVGIPKVMQDEKGSYLDYVLPKDMRDGEVEAIFMDEFNRSHKKVRNAVMELLQFRSMNGRPFPNLKMIWASINPEDEGDYQVEALDKGQRDRFPIIIGIPYEPKLEYFMTKFSPRQARAAVEWWSGLSEELKMEVSPRRLEYALQVFNMAGGDIKDVLPHSASPSKLNTLLKTGPVDEKLKELFTANDLETAKKYLQVDNNYATASRYLCSIIPDAVDEDAWKLFFLQATPTEKLASMMATNEAAYKFIVANVGTVPIFARMVRDAIATNTDKVLVRRLKKEKNVLQPTTYGGGNVASEQPYFSSKISKFQWGTLLGGWKSQPMDTTPQRMKIYEELADSIPKMLTPHEAVDTLEMISKLAGRSHSSTLKAMRHVLGIVNHCIDQINKGVGLSWPEIQTNYGSRFNDLLEKMQDNGMDKKLYCPLRKVN